MKPDPPKVEELPYGLRVIVAVPVGVPAAAIFWFLGAWMLDGRVRGSSADRVFVPVALAVGSFLAIVAWLLVSRTTRGERVVPPLVAAIVVSVFLGLVTGLGSFPFVGAEGPWLGGIVALLSLARSARPDLVTRGRALVVAGLLALVLALGRPSPPPLSTFEVGPSPSDDDRPTDLASELSDRSWRPMRLVEVFGEGKDTPLPWLSASGTRVLAGLDEDGLQAYELPAKEPIFSWRRGRGERWPRGVLIDGGARAVAHVGSTLHVFDLPSGARRELGSHADFVVGLAPVPGSSRVVSTSFDGALSVWDAGRAEAGPVLSLQVGAPRQPAFCVAATETRIAAAGAATVRDWSAKEGEPNFLTFQAHLRLWEAATGAFVRDLPSPGEVRELAFTKDGATLACLLRDRLELVTVADGATRSIPLEAPGDLSDVAFPGDGGTAVVSHLYGLIVVDLVRGAVLERLGRSKDGPGPVPGFHGLALLPGDGTLLVAASGGKLWRFELGGRIELEAESSGPGEARPR